MADFDMLADRRDICAMDRDDAAERRDRVSAERDGAADLRDARADDRAKEARHLAVALAAQVTRVRRQILDRLTRIENTTFDEGAWPDLTPDSLARLRAHAAEQRRLAGVDRDAVDGLFGGLKAEVRHGYEERYAAAADRRAAARDRAAARIDRGDSAHDRDDAARDRAQADIERQQADPAGYDGAPIETVHTGMDEPLTDRVAHAVAESRQRIAESLELLTQWRYLNDPPARNGPDADGPAHS